MSETVSVQRDVLSRCVRYPNGEGRNFDKIQTTYLVMRGPWESVRYNPASNRKIPQWAATAIRAVFPEAQIPNSRIKFT